MVLRLHKESARGMAAYEFEWDDAKAARNLRKHGVRFEDVMAIFSDPLLLTIADPDHSGGLIYLTQLAKEKDTTLNILVNQLLKKDIELIAIGA
jgi:uncharacterized DUF497 family protein